jgi:hypothetical protein
MKAEFYKSEAEYWQKEATRRADILNVIRDACREVLDNIAHPPEPPVGTRYFHDGEVTWVRDDKGWVCSNIGCRNCPITWEEAWEYGINRADLRGLPDD